MKGLDTNILIRYLVQDDPKQCAAVNRAFEKARYDGETFVISPIVLCEIVWVLEAAYSCTRSEIVHALERVLRTAQFEVLDKDTVWSAWSDYRDGKGDFSDFYLGRQHHVAGAELTLTFDKALKSSKYFCVLQGS
jgi:predicted nucleic-acid-binding protein